MGVLAKKLEQAPVVVSKASNKNNCVEFIVLLESSKNSSATKTILLEFITPPSP